MVPDARRGLLLVMMEPQPEFEPKLNRWYDEEHFPERLAIPGFLGGRRYVAVEGSPKYLALYDLESPDVLKTPDYLAKAEPPSPWTAQVRKHVKIQRNVYVDITPEIPSNFEAVRRPAEEL